MLGNMTEIIKKKLRDELAVLEHELAHDIPKELEKGRCHGGSQRERRNITWPSSARNS